MVLSRESLLGELLPPPPPPPQLASKQAIPTSAMPAIRFLFKSIPDFLSARFCSRNAFILIRDGKEGHDCTQWRDCAKSGNLKLCEGEKDSDAHSRCTKEAQSGNMCGAGCAWPAREKQVLGVPLNHASSEDLDAQKFELGASFVFDKFRADAGRHPDIGHRFAVIDDARAVFFGNQFRDRGPAFDAAADRARIDLGIRLQIDFTHHFKWKGERSIVDSSFLFYFRLTVFMADYFARLQIRKEVGHVVIVGQNFPSLLRRGIDEQAHIHQYHPRMSLDMNIRSVGRRRVDTGHCLSLSKSGGQQQHCKTVT